ncbi:MAG: murein biosynthesis integral membrane protein MurJ [Anaerolineae bacterium]|nr:murein biosynthesis integral membrane protein MurJ [Anaerolineae bacterium]
MEINKNEAAQGQNKNHQAAPLPAQLSPLPPTQPPPATGMARAASIIAAGNVTSRILGLAREIVIANLFGATGLVSAFRAAQIIPIMLYDLLIGGMVSSALVPVFSEQAERDRNALWHLASLVLSMAVVVLVVVVLIMELAAPQVAFLLVGGFDEELLAATARLMRLTTPAVLFLSLSGIITGLLYALKRFALPAFTAAIFNATIVVVALIGAFVFNWGIEALAIGLLLGAFFQVGLQLPGLRDARLRFVLNIHHPHLRRIGKLYLPVILGLVVSQVAIALDRNFASRTGEQSIAWMQYATTLIQFPLGLVAAAISLAILPTLSRLALATTDALAGLDEFMNTLATGLRLVLILIIPATVALFVLAKPLIALIFEHGDFTPFDTQQTVLALRLYLIGLTFAAVDQPLIFAFYARQNTLTPALVGLLGVGFYLIAALLPTLLRPMQMTDLVLANSIQLAGHALVMIWLIHRQATLRGRGLGPTTLKAMAASLVMGIGLWAGLPLLQNRLPGQGVGAEITLVGLLSLAGGGLYFLALALLKTPELALLTSLLQRFLPKQ